MKSLKALFLDDEPDSIELFVDTLNRRPDGLFRLEPISIVEAYDNALHELQRAGEDEQYDIIFLDIRFIENGNENNTLGIEYLRKLRASKYWKHPIVMLTIRADYAHQIDALNAGCDGFITKTEKDVTPDRAKVFDYIIEQSLQMAQLRARYLDGGWLEVPGTLKVKQTTFYGVCEEMRMLFWDIIRIASIRTLRAKADDPPLDIPNVLIRGDTGTGKSSVARAIHLMSDRREGPFHEVVLSAIPETLIEPELFGTEHGIATGVTARTGFIRASDGGTLFLDEIGEVSNNIQVKLLQSLREKKITPVGSTESIPVDFRLITATHQDLEDKMKAGYLRADFYHRINGKHLKLPTLEERFKDPRELEEMITAEMSTKKMEFILNVEAKAALKSHSWPGNYAEFKSLMMNLAGDLISYIGPTLLNNRLVKPRSAGESLNCDEILKSNKGKIAPKLFCLLYASSKVSEYGTVPKAARAVGVNESTLRRWLDFDAAKNTGDEDSNA